MNEQTKTARELYSELKEKRCFCTFLMVNGNKYFGFLENYDAYNIRVRNDRDKNIFWILPILQIALIASSDPKEKDFEEDIRWIGDPIGNGEDDTR